LRGVFFEHFPLKGLLPAAGWIFFAGFLFVFLAVVFFAGAARHEPLSHATNMASLRQVFSSGPSDG